MSKICTQCKIEYPLSNYHKRAMVKSGLDAWCKGCKNLYRAEYYIKNKEKEMTRSRIKAWKQIGVNITFDEFYSLVNKQNNKCVICQRHTTTLNVDHNHQTGKIRGLLCGSCNRGIGLLQENINVLQRAIAYLEEQQ